MKALFTLFFSVSTLFVFGQWSTNSIVSTAFSEEVNIMVPAPKESLYLQRYRGIFFGIGPRYLNNDAGTIVTSYVDDSPSMDNFSTTLEVKEGYLQPALNFGYKGGNYRGPSHDYMMDVSLNTKRYAVKVAYSWGWNFLTKFKNSDLVIRPSIQGVIGNSVFNLGELRNNALYIQVEDTQYYERELNVELRAESVTVAPRIDFTYVFADRWDVYLRAAYDIPTGDINPRLVISVPEALRTENSPGDSSLDIDGDNPTVTYQGRTLTNFPYTTGGLRVTFGVSFLWNR
jgi:hypothetical protein